MAATLIYAIGVHTVTMAVCAFLHIDKDLSQFFSFSAAFLTFLTTDVSPK